ncbi:DUF4349 domain-containing protein [Herbidospora sp. NBRC 101105]|uniref:DUF4349 domain-containing protein n=1 Tax=Herbidospora sp. NBRC 101105 TaxID=3032195 RepID=UPI0024A0B8A3|nr:DUF4349 domain-containing protein [Herbidospora sp. NBRC 101105]GLX94332.1 hypothetical protein Hesp01_22820 [Herbidospora sp. NBRC 101105]
MNTLRSRAVLPLVVAAFLLTACAGGGVESTSAPAVGGAADAPSLSREAAAPAAEPQAEDAAGEEAKAADTGSNVTVAPVDRAIIYKAEMTVRAKDVAAATESAKRMVTEAGGYVAEERSNSFASRQESTITFKIPPGQYPGTLSRLGRELGETEQLHQGTQDVTGEVADVAARVKSAEAAVAQFRTLLTKAEKIGEIMDIEREIQSRTADLEALQARQKSLAEQTGMATVTITFVGPSAPPVKPVVEETGFLAGLKAGWTGLKNFAEALSTIVGALLPWLVVLAVLALLALPWWRRMRRRQPLPAPVPAPVPAAEAREEELVEKE